MTYYAFAVTKTGLEEIERYKSLGEAVQDLLYLWPEDPDNGVVIIDGKGNKQATMEHWEDDPSVCKITYVDNPVSEYFRCFYWTDFQENFHTTVNRILK